MKDDRDCKKCTYYLSDECISCTPKDSNFEPKEEKMNGIKLTEEQFIEMDRYLYSNIDSDNSRTLRLILAKEKGWIIKDEIETAIEDFIKYNGYIENTFNNSLMHEKHAFCVNQYRKANKVIELLQAKISKLEGK